MKKVLDWKFFLRVAVAVTALTLFLSAALAADGAEIVRVYDATRSAEVKLKEAQLAFLGEYMREHKDDFDKYVEDKKAIKFTLKIGETQYAFNSLLSNLITVPPGTDFEGFMHFIDHEIDELRAENQDHLTVHESTAVIPHAGVEAVPSDTTSEGSSDKELIASLVRCIKQMQAEFNQSIKTSAAIMALLKAEIDKAKKEQDAEMAKLIHYLGFKEQENQVNELTSQFSQFVRKYVELKRAEQKGDLQRASQLNEEVQFAIADIYPRVEQQKRDLSYQNYSLQIKLAQLNEEFNKKESSDARKEAIQKEAQGVREQLSMVFRNLKDNFDMENKLREILQETQVPLSDRQQNLMLVNPTIADEIRAKVGGQQYSHGAQFQGQGVVSRGSQPREQTFAGFLKARQNPYAGGSNVRTPQPVRTSVPNDGFTHMPRGTFEGDMAVNPMPPVWRNPLVEHNQQWIQYRMQQQARQAQIMEQDMFSGRLNFL